MTKTQKVILISVPFLIGAYLIYRQFRKPKSTNLNKKQEAIEKIKETPKKIDNPTPSCNYPLKKGLYNCSVVGLLQKALNTYPFVEGNDRVLVDIPSALLIVDDKFGPKTEAFLSAVTSDLSINRKSKSVTYTWYQVQDESAFNLLVDEINNAIKVDSYRPGVSAPLYSIGNDPNSWENNPANPNYQLTHPNG